MRLSSSAITPHVLSGANFTTYRIGGALQEAYQPASEAELTALLMQAHEREQALTLLGWGGNSIIASQGIPGMTIITRKLDWVETTSPTRVAFGAGVHLAKVSQEALKRSLTGGEFFIGIPGTVGGAIRMNAGALGQETANVVREVRLFNRLTGVVETWLPEQLDFQYRRSAIDPTQHIIMSAVFEFQPGQPDAISQMMNNSVQFRKTHHPKEPNGGSVFKNPSKEMPMGRLMDELGAKGQWTEGDVKVSPLHGNFIINIGNGTSTDVLRLMTRMKQAVYEHYGLTTHPENLLLGDLTDEEQALWQALTAGATH